MAISMQVGDIDALLGFGSPEDDKKKLLKQAGAQNQQQPTQAPTLQPQTLKHPTVPPQPMVNTLEGNKPAPPAPVEAPDLNALPAASTPPLTLPTPQPKKPTAKESIAAGLAQHPEENGNAKAEGKRQFEEMRPQVTAEPGTVEYGQQKQARLDYDNQHPWGADIGPKPGIWGKIGHIASRVGNIAGDIVAPEEMALVPGTDLNKQLQAKGNASWIKMGADTEQKQAETANQQAEAWVRMHPKDKPVGTPQTTENGELMQEMQHPDGTTSMVDLNQKGKPNVWVGTIEDPNNPGQYIIAQSNKNQPGAAPTKIGGAKPINAPVHTLVMTDPADKKDYEYQYDNSGEQGPEHWKKVGPARPNALSLGLVGTYQPKLDTNGNLTGFYNTKDPSKTLDAEGKPVVAGAAGPGGTTSAGARMGASQRQDFQHHYIDPANQVEISTDKANSAMDAYNKNPKTGAAGMLELSSHIATTLGSVKGVSTGENMIHEHENAISLLDRIGRFGDYLTSGQPLSAQQMHDFNQLINETRAITWQVAAKEGARRQKEGQQIKLDFVPADVNIPMKTPGGKLIQIPGNRLDEAIKDGLSF
jgi:hypothetical protein